MIYYDITDLLQFFESHSQVSGIQRVAVTIIQQFLTLAKTQSQPENLMLIAHHPRLKRIVMTEAAFFERPDITGVDFCAHFGLRRKTPSDELSAFLLERYSQPWQRAFHGRRLALKNRLTGGKTFRQKGIALPRGDGRAETSAVWRPAEFNPGDVIYLSGATWGKIPYLQELGRLRAQRQIKIVHLIYDVIPVKRPEFMSKRISFAFEDWLVLLNQIADAILTNAEVTRDDLVSFATDAGLPPFRAIHVVPLAHEFLSAGKNDAPKLGRNALYAKISPNVLQAARLPFVLCVGTLEIRKNNWGLAQVWQKLRQKHGYALPRLVFAGRPGWLNDEFNAFLTRTNRLEGAIVTLEGASDEEIAFLYQHCLFSLFPSFAEGWGLPIGESLWFGRPVITSHVSSMPEVAGRYADYIDPYDLVSLEQGVEKMLDPAYRQARLQEIAAMPLRRWSEVAENIWRRLHSI